MLLRRWKPLSNLPGQIRQSGQLPDQRPRFTAGVLRLPGRALEALTDTNPLKAPLPPSGTAPSGQRAASGLLRVASDQLVDYSAAISARSIHESWTRTRGSRFWYGNSLSLAHHHYMIIWCPVFLSCPQRQQIDEEAVAPGSQFSDAAPGRFGGNARGETLFQLGRQRRIAQGHVPPCHSMRSSLLTRRWRAQDSNLRSPVR